MSVAFDAVRKVLADGVGAAYPGAVACVVQGGVTRFHEAVGARRILPERVPNDVETRYDLASLTKPVVATLAAEAVASGRLSLDDRVADGLPGCHPTWIGVTLGHLLGHTSGLPAFYDFSATTPAEVRRSVLATPLTAPPGEAAVYSDLGYMALGFWLEALHGRPLDALVAEALAPLFPLGLRYVPPPSPLHAPTELCARRGLVDGVVHDPNAWALGGVAGHAGLFGSAADVARWAAWLLGQWRARSPLGHPSASQAVVSSQPAPLKARSDSRSASSPWQSRFMS